MASSSSIQKAVTATTVKAAATQMARRDVRKLPGFSETGVAGISRMRPNMKTTAVLAFLVIVPFLTASAQRHRTSYSVRSSADVRSHSDYSALTSASARQKSQQKDLKKLEEQFARLSGTSQQPSRSGSQQIKPLKIDEPSRRGSGINFTRKSQKTHGTSGARGRRTGPDLHSLRAMHSGTH